MSIERDKRAGAEWRFWGPYLSERQWGTVREDYSADGSAWSYFPHDMARSRAYRWGEDGLGGISDIHGDLCFCLGLWNGKDPILKERLFGLSGPEGNHGEDVKELYYYLDSTPSHSYMQMLYKYPHREFPYAHLVAENRKRSKLDPEYELVDTGLFDQNRYWDVSIEYAKESPCDILVRVRATNRGPDPVILHFIPQLWYRNRWSWDIGRTKPKIALESHHSVSAHHDTVGDYHLSFDYDGRPLFCDNDSNPQRVYGLQDAKGYWKDGFHDYVVRGTSSAVNPESVGTKAGIWSAHATAPGEQVEIRLRLTRTDGVSTEAFSGFTHIFDQRKAECEEFYRELQDGIESDDARLVQEEVFEKLNRHLLVHGPLQRELKCDAHHVKRIHRHPCGAI